ncbi:hypothetical protein ACFTZB_00765 [Rhodococcus sp. NPDC057014]|uniref:hypothetical protein n=1 Tax=Rhodococcus sp. NPDC057014 TaxID=3346000 RepID=UPI003633B5BD
MKKFLQETHDWLANIQKAADTEQDPRRKGILYNYLHHAAFELTGDLDELLATDRTIEHPVYRARLDGADEAVVIDGADAVRGFYGRLNDGVITMADERLAVADWGFAAFNTIKLTIEGEKLIELGTEVDDPAAHYAVTRPLCMFWDYDSQGRLIGENLYEAALPKVTKLSPEEVVTADEVAEVVRPFRPR